MMDVYVTSLAGFKYKGVGHYKIIDSNTDKDCFPSDPGFIFQKFDSCDGIEYTWRAGDDLYLREYSDNTAKITGTVIDQNGRVAPLDMLLSDKEYSGNTWSASCYLDVLSGPKTFYRSFSGTITIDGVPVTVSKRLKAHFVLSQGAGFDSNQYGLGAWTGGALASAFKGFRKQQGEIRLAGGRSSLPPLNRT